MEISISTFPQRPPLVPEESNEYDLPPLSCSLYLFVPPFLIEPNVVDVLNIAPFGCEPAEKYMMPTDIILVVNEPANVARIGHGIELEIVGIMHPPPL